MVWKRNYISAIAAVLFTSVVAIFGYPSLDHYVINSKQGNSIASRNTDTVVVAAIACKAFYERTDNWPQSWKDLESDLRIAMFALNASRLNEVNADPNRSTVPLELEELRDCVDINFSADPKILGTQTWTNFTGIVPHWPVARNLFPVNQVHLHFWRRSSAILALIVTLLWFLTSRFHALFLTQYSPSTQNDPGCRSKLVNFLSFSGERGDLLVTSQPLLACVELSQPSWSMRYESKACKLATAFGIFQRRLFH